MTELKTPTDHIILVPVDFSESSENAVDYAVKMAQLFDNQITLLHVLNKSALGGLFTSDDQKELIRAGVDKRLQEFKSKILSVYPDVRLNILVEEGKPYKTIQKIADENNTDTIVMGTNGINAVEQFIGSTTTRLLKVAKRPIIVVKEKRSSPTFKDIVVPIDLTKESKQKLKWAARLGLIYNSTIHIIMEVEKDEFLKQRVDANLRYAREFMEDNNVKHVVKLLDDLKYPDHFGKDIVQYADEVDADLIMIMTQEEAGLSDLFLGSYAEQIVNSAQKTPVMCIKPIKTDLAGSGGAGFYS